VSRLTAALLTTLVGVVGVLAIAPLGDAATAPEPRAKNADVTKLFPRAVERVRAARNGAFAKAVMLEAEGLPKGDQPVQDASGITNWRFVLDNQKTKGSKFLSVFVDHTAKGGFGKVKGKEEPFVEDRRIREAPEMTLGGGGFATT
jgi:hypothetical protein